MYNDEQKLRDEQHDLATKAEKRANDLQLEIEEIRAQLEQVGYVLILIELLYLHIQIIMIVYKYTIHTHTHRCNDH